MKKALSLLLVLVLVLCLSLCACANNKEKAEDRVSKEKVEEELQGRWEYSWYASVAGFYCSVVYEFDDGELRETYTWDDNVEYRYGSYVITDKVVEIWFDNEDKPNAELTYTYEDGKLSLVNYGDGTVEQQYVKLIEFK